MITPRSRKVWVHTLPARQFPQQHVAAPTFSLPEQLNRPEGKAATCASGRAEPRGYPPRHRRKFHGDIW